MGFLLVYAVYKENTTVFNRSLISVISETLLKHLKHSRFLADSAKVSYEHGEYSVLH